ncbi:MAG: NHL repeat-containing protein [Solirubrobacterales bacterium]
MSPARAAVATVMAALVLAAPARAAVTAPLFAFVPAPVKGENPPKPPPGGYLNGPCGLAVGAAGDFYVSDYHHDAVDSYSVGAAYSSPSASGATGYLGQLAAVAAANGPCGLAVDASGRFYVNVLHGAVLRFASFPSGARATLDPGPATGVAVDPATGVVYVNDRTHLAAYEPSGAPLEVGGEPLAIGLGTLEDGYGVAVSAYPATAGFLYVPDAATNTVKVYDPAAGTTDPVESISGPPGGFTSLRDSAVAVDAASGDIYVLDDLSPAGATQPVGIVDVFDSSGAYVGHLAHEVVDGLPSGLAVDNSGGSTQGRVYVSSGNTMNAGVYAYPPGAAGTAAPLAPSIPVAPPGGESLFPTTPIGGPVPGGGGTRIECQGDGCQILPPEPSDPALDTLLVGRGNPKPRYKRQTHRRTGRRSHHHRRKGGRRTDRGGKGHRRDRPARASRITTRSSRTNSASVATLPPVALGAGGAAAIASAALAPGEAGFLAEVPAADGDGSAKAGSHPYRLSLHVGLDQGSGEADLRSLGLELPPGFLADPAAVGFCGAAQFATDRTSPFEAAASGEDCPAHSQVGVVRVETGLGPRRSFGLFELDAATGAALTLGASPYGEPLIFNGLIDEGEGGLHLDFRVEAPAGLRLHGLTMDLWGAPWDAAHDAQRGDCLNEVESSFASCREAAWKPAPRAPFAFLTLPTGCTPTLAFTATTTSWQDPTPAARQTLYRDSEGNPVPLGGCASLRFPARPEGLLSVRKASSSSGFVFRLDAGEDPGLANPRGRAYAQPRDLTVQLPRGVTLNPSVGAGLGVCTAAGYAAESATGSPGSGCPDESKIGDFIVRVPFYEGQLRGAVYLAAPHDNPFGSLLAVYLVAKAADRGVLVKVAGKVTPDPTDGTLSATFEGLPQLPYTELEVNFRSGQRAPLISPGSCGPALTRIQASPWSGTAPIVAESPSPIENGIEGGPCPGGGAPPFSPRVHAGGVNSAAGTYTPYFVRLSRSDTEQEITSYSLVLPRGITAKLAGIPFCTDAAIEAARHSSGVAEAADPSCPPASQVGRTVSGYGVGPALSYAKGRIYLAGPYHGSPLSLVTVDPATIGPFDLGTIVVRSAFDLDPRTAQLRIDSAASDPIPHIVGGVVLHLRDIRVYMDRHEFTHNPTSCEPSRLESTLTGSGSPFTDPHQATASATSYFQLLDCRELPFRPRLGLRLRGGVARGAYPSLRATFAARPGDADLKRIAVAMPHSEFLAQGHIRAICTQTQFATETCPPGSVYGRAVAFTPLLSAPLRGDVYLRSSTHKLPDLVADLRSGSIRIDLEGRIGTSKQGGILAYFDELPDGPIERFTMILRGGRHGLLTNSVNICRHPPTATVQALGQNNRGTIFSSLLRGQCRKKKPHGKGKGGARHHGKHGGGR